ISALSGWDYHCVFDVLLEFIRHDLLDMISLMLPREGALLFAIRDLLTSLKCDAGECILSGQFLDQHRSTQELLVANVNFVQRLLVNSRVLASFALASGAGRHGLIWLQQQFQLVDKDWVFRDLAPVLLSAGVTSLDAVREQREALIEAGVSPQQLQHLQGDDSSSSVVPQPERRSDLPVVHQRKRASFQASVEAAAPDKRAATLRRLHEDFTAPSTVGPLNSRIRTWCEWSAAWEVAPFLLTFQTISCCAASMKAGAYRSCSQYFSAAVKHQERTLRVPVDPSLKALIRDCKRSILRGLGPDQLKDSFEVPKLRPLIPSSSWGTAPWDPSDVQSWLDAMIISLWFMFREVELAALRRGHLYLEDGQVVVLIASEKKVLSGKAARFAFPDCDGNELSKAAVVRGFRLVLQEAGIALTRPDESGRPLQRFHGHVCRVSGAQWLISLNLAVHLVQILGRWSSAAIWKYIQNTPLLQLPAATEQALHACDGTVGSEDAAAAGLILAPATEQAQSSHNGPSMQDLQSIRDEMEALRQAARPRGETLIQSVRSRLIHRIKVNEDSNPPKKWRSVCGWPYGVINFTRLPASEAHE
ncbi:unnamed protein product, partial [Symbiodinium necroappetens]